MNLCKRSDSFELLGKLVLDYFTYSTLIKEKHVLKHAFLLIHIMQPR